MKKMGTVLNLACLLAVICSQVNAKELKNNDENIEKKDDFDIINIKAPDKNGVSVNNFSNFNVEKKGAIINNIEAKSKYQSVNFGQIDGNKNITNKEADIAVFNVNGDKETNLKSTLEAASSKPLKLYISNENGIMLDGANFVNIDKLVLTTGLIDESDMAVLVRKGKVSISDKGIKGLKNLAIFSENFENKGKIGAENTKLVLGHNFIKKENAAYTLDTNYVSANNLGSIYGNDIQIQSTGYTDINVDELLSKNKIDINTKGKLKNNGKILALNKIDIKAKSLENKGKVNFDNNSFILKWIDANSKVYGKEELEKIWNKEIKHTLTPEDTALFLTGSLLNQWFTDENFVKTASPNANIFKRFDDTLNKINNEDKNTFLIKEGKKIVQDKHKQRDFVNKADVYATELNDKKILEAVAISTVKANQAIISSKDIDIKLEDELLNQDALIKASDNLNIKAAKLVNKNSLSNDISLKDGYENIAWDLMVIQKDIRANYDIIYKRGLVSDDATRKTKIAAINKSKIEAKNIKLDVENITLVDNINTGVAIKADKLETNSKKINLKGQSIEAKEYKLKTDDLILNNASIYTQKMDLDAKNVELLSTKDKEVVIKTDKENLSKEVISSSAIYAKEDLKIKTKNLKLLGSIIKSDNKLNIETEVLDNLADTVTKDYKSSYDISKTYRKIKHNEKSQRAVASFIHAKDLVLNSKKTNNKGSYIVGTNSINFKSGTTKIDAIKINNELERNYGVDNGILGVNYNKVKKMETDALGSIVLSKGDIKAKIDKELEIVGSSIKGKKIFIEAENIKIDSKKLETKTETESRQLLTGDLKGSFEKNNTLDNISLKVDMEVYKNEKTETKEIKNLKSELEADEVKLVAKKENQIKGSDIKGDKIEIKGKIVKIEDSKSSLEINKNKVSAKVTNKVGLNEANLESDNKLIIENDKENLTNETSNSSNINAKSKVLIEGEKVLIKGSNVEAKDIKIKAKDKIDIVNGENKEKYTKNGEKVTLGANVKVDAKVLGIVQTLKKLVDERENLLAYALNPVSGYQKAKEYKEALERNINNIKKLYDNIKANKIDPESLGISMLLDGSVRYDKNFLDALSIDSNGSFIKGETVSIETEDELTLKASKIKADKLEIKAEKTNLNAFEKRKDLNETNAGVGVNLKHEVISKTTSVKGDASVSNKGNYNKEYVSSEIETNIIDLKTKELNLENSKINAKEGKVKADKLNIKDKADKETKYGINLTGMYDNGGKFGVGNAAIKVEHNQKVKNESKIELGTAKLEVKEKNIKKEFETDINFNTQAGVNIDPNGNVKGKVNGGTKAKLEKKGSKVKGTGYVGLNGELAFEDGEITDANVTAELKGDLTITPNKNIEEIKLKLENKFTIDKEGEFKNDLNTNVDALISVSNENLKGKLNLSVDSNLGLDNNGLNKFDNKLNANGSLDTNVKVGELLDAKLKLKGDLNLSKDLETKLQTSANLNAESDLVIKGKIENVDGAINLNSKYDLKLDNEKGLKDYSVNSKVDGKLNVKGEKDAFKGDMEINLKSEILKEKDKKVSIKNNLDGNANLGVSGKIEHLQGDINLNLNGKLATSGKNIETLEGKVSTNGNLEAKGSIDSFNGDIKINADANLVAKKDEKVKLDGNLKGKSNLELVTNLDKTQGSISVSPEITIKGNNEKKLEILDTNVKLKGDFKKTYDNKYLKDLFIKLESELNAKKDKLVNFETLIDGKTKFNYKNIEFEINPNGKLELKDEKANLSLAVNDLKIEDVLKKLNFEF